MIYSMVSSTALLCCCYVITGVLSISSISKEVNEKDLTNGTNNNRQISLFEIEGNDSNTTETSVARVRFKRQQSSGSGKFTQAANVPQLKMLRLFLTMFKNLWATSYVGGSNPFHHYVPKPVVQLYREKIFKFFFPDIGEDPRRQK